MITSISPPSYYLCNHLPFRLLLAPIILATRGAQLSSNARCLHCQHRAEPTLVISTASLLLGRASQADTMVPFRPSANQTHPLRAYKLVTCFTKTFECEKYWNVILSSEYWRQVDSSADTNVSEKQNVFIFRVEEGRLDPCDQRLTLALK